MFVPNSDSQKLIENKNAWKKSHMYKESYILYKGKMVSSNLIDIEVHFSNNSEFKRKIMIDTNDDMKLLQSRICEACEFFPKLCGLSGLMAVNLKKKTEQVLVELKETGLIGDTIHAKDVIVFDLNFFEIWLEVDMTLESEEKSYLISFELKIQMDSFKSQFENLLIRLGIQSWAKYSGSDNKSDYYLFQRLSVEYPNNPQAPAMSSKNNGCQFSEINFAQFDSDKVHFNYDSKLQCKLEFINFTELICNEVIGIDEGKRDSFVNNQRKKVIKNFFNNYFDTFLLQESQKSKLIGHHLRVVWKSLGEEIQSKSQEDRLTSLMYVNSPDDSEDSISVENMSLNASYVDYLEKRNSGNDFSPYTAVNPGRHSLHHGDLMKVVKMTKFDPKYARDFHALQNTIDYNLKIQKYSGNYLTTREFYQIFLPDTRNLTGVTGNSNKNLIACLKNFSSDAPISEEDVEIKNWKLRVALVLKKYLICILIICVVILTLYLLYFQ